MDPDVTVTLHAVASGNLAKPGTEGDEPGGPRTAVRVYDANADVIDVPAVTRLFCVGRNTVYARVARNAIPHRRLGKQFRPRQQR